MWFKQVQIFQLTDALRFTKEEWSAKLEPLAFRPCLPSMPVSSGWVSPLEEDTPLVHMLNSNVMLCLQLEEKILPAVVIRQELANKIKEIELTENRKVRPKEKQLLKDEIQMTLLTRSFSKLSRLYGYIDTKNNWLVLSTDNEKRKEQFISLFKKSITENVHLFQVKKLSSIITQWVKSQNYPTTFSVEKSCVLQDPNQKNRIIRCQQQDLFAHSIQSLIKEGCEVKKLALGWQDKINFTLADNFTLSGIKYQDEIISQVKEMEVETELQQFNADFFIMSEILGTFLKELLEIFIDTTATSNKSTSNQLKEKTF